jgi:hypothetical protein
MARRRQPDRSRPCGVSFEGNISSYNLRETAEHSANPTVLQLLSMEGRRVRLDASL